MDSRHAVDNLVKSRQLEIIKQGVYIRWGSTLTWKGVIYTLQHLEKTDLMMGGLTALKLQGFQHYLSFSSQEKIHLYGMDRAPAWLDDVISDVQFEYHNMKGFLGRDDGQDPSREAKPSNLLRRFSVPYSWREDLQPLWISSVEKAYLELLMDVPATLSFELADQLLQGMTQLSPRQLERLLKLCRNVKVRRLFYWFAGRVDYPWVHRLPDPQSLDSLGLGSGNRMLMKGGRLDPKYKITVPEEMWTAAKSMMNKSHS